MYVAVRGAAALRSRQRATVAAASAAGKSSSTLRAWVPVCGSRNSNSVTTPKLPPPPRSPQNSSGFSSAAARTTSPAAVTTVNDSTLSQDRPCCRASQPIPPPRVRPPTPVCETLPAVDGQPVRLAGDVEGAEQGAALHPRPPALGVDADAAHRRQVEHQPALGHGVPDDAVAAAPDAELQSLAAGQRDGVHHVRRLVRPAR